MILVFNPGSSSLKYKIYDKDLTEVGSGSVANIGSSSIKNHTEATKKLCSEIKNLKLQIDVIGYRVVHGGGLLENGSIADDKNIKVLVDHSGLAPLHNPQALQVIQTTEPYFGKAKHLMFFDTDFFKSLPEEESTYPLPIEIAKENNIKRFGFHGISHKYVMAQVDPTGKENLITIHLGAGCSITAISSGKAIAHSLGFTPDEGLIMQTRSGDIDPGIIFFLVEKYGIEIAKKIIEKESGLSGMTGTDGNMLNVLYLAKEKIEDPDFQSQVSRTEDNEKQAKLALKIYVRRIQKYIAYYALLLGHVDKLVFTGNIGYGSSVIRDMVTERLESLPIDEFVRIKPDEEKAIATEIWQKHI